MNSTHKVIILVTVFWAIIFSAMWLKMNIPPEAEEMYCCTNWSCPYAVGPIKEMEAKTNGTYKAENITLDNITYDISGNISVVWFPLSSKGCAHIHYYTGLDNIKRNCKCLENQE